MGAELRNPFSTDIGPQYVTFRYFDAEDNSVLTANVTLIGIAAKEEIVVATNSPWEGPPPARLEVETLGGDFDYDAVPTAELEIAHAQPDARKSVAGSVVNGSDLNAQRLRVHCVYYEDDELRGGVLERLDRLGPESRVSWQVDLPEHADRASCSAIDRPDQFGAT